MSEFSQGPWPFGGSTVGSQSAVPPRSPQPGRFVGRAIEKAQLVASVEQIVAGEPVFVAVSGEPGVGKTRLVHESLDSAGHPAHWARSNSNGTDPAFWPLLQLLRSMRVRFGHEAYAAAIGLDAVGLMDPLVDPVAAAQGGLGEVGRFQLFDRVLGALTRLAAIEPLVLVLDDVQWADWSTIGLLTLVARSVTDLPLGLILTVRDVGAPEPSAPLAELLAQATVVRLNRFNRRTSAEMLDSLVSGGVAADYLDAAFDSSGGNPHYLFEYASLVSPNENAVAGRLAGIGAAKLDRAALLEPDARLVIEAAAVLGDTFALDAAAGVAQTSTAEALRVLTRETHGLVAPKGNNNFGFVHGLNREAVYGAIEPRRRQELHARAAEVLAAAEQGDSSGAVAFHLGLSEPAPGDTAILDRLIAAANDADHAHAREEAVRRYGLALDELSRLELADGRSAALADTRLKLLMAQGRTLAGLARHDESRACLRPAAALARRLGDVESLARVALAFPPGMETVAIAPEADPEQVSLREEALAALDPGDSLLRAELMGALGVCQYWSCHLSGHPDRFDQSLRRQDELSQAALDMARRLNDARTLASCVQHRLHAVWTPDFRHERDELVEELIGLAEELGDLDLLAAAVGWQILSAFDLGRIREAESLVATYAQLADRLAQPLYRRNAHQWGACARVLRGDIDGGIQAMMGAMATSAAVIGDENAVTEAAMLLSVQRFFTGDYEGLIEPARHVIASNLRTSLNWQTGLMFMLAETGQTDEARALFEELTADGNSLVPRDINWLVSTQLLALTAVHLMDRPRGETLYRELLEHERVDVTHGWGYASYGPVGWALGELAAMLGRLDDAARHLTDVVENREAGPYRAVAELKLCQVLMELEPGESPAILERIDRLAAMFRAWGALRFAREAETILSSHALASRSTGNVVARVADGWRLSGDGLTGSDGVVLSGRGAQYLVELLSAPGIPIAAGDLVAAATTSGSASSRHLKESGGMPGRLGEVIDSTARRAYERRLAVLVRTRKRALRRGERWRVDECDGEMQAIRAELDASSAPGGRARLHSDTSERARVSVTKAIRRAIHALYETAPALARHLEDTVSTGSFCSYGPHGSVREWLITTRLNEG